MSISNFKLYEISTEYQRAIELMLSENNDVFIKEIEDTFDNKNIAVAKYTKNLESEYDEVIKASDAMLKRAKRLSKNFETLRAHIKSNLESTGLLDPIKCPEFVIKIAKNRSSLVIDNDELIPDIYKKTKEVITFDKVAIKKDIESGFEVDGARIHHNTRLTIL
jgi:hypothetical protein